MKFPILTIIVLLVVLFAVVTVAELIKPKPLYASISPNPLDLTKFEESSALLDVGVVNTMTETISSVVVRVEEVGSSQLIIFPASRRIDSMAPGTEQQLSQFVIRPDPNRQINSGSYKLNISLLIEGEKQYEKELVIVIKAV